MTTEPSREPTRHPLLARQLERCAIDDVPTGEQWHDFVSRVERSYHDADRAQTLVEQTLEVSAREFSSMYAELQSQAAHVLSAERNRLQLVFDSVTTALVVIERSGRITNANPEAVRLFGDLGGLIDHHLADTVLMVGRDGAARPMLPAAELDDVLLAGRWTRNDVRLVAASGRDLGDGAKVPAEQLVAADVAIVPFVEDDVCVGGLVIVTDNAEREAARERLAWQASHDPLTGLANRSMVTEKIELALVQARRSNAWPSLVLLDLDRFKHVNDSFGHAAGDRLLTLAAERLLGCVRSIDTVARLGGDEFVILVEAAGDTGLVRSLADRVLAAVAEPFELSGEATHVTGSIGIAHSGPMYNSAEALLHDADLAMYRAKERGRNCYDVADDRPRLATLPPPADGPGLFGDALPEPVAAPVEQVAAYRVLARKYRPSSFDDLIGQEAMVRTVSNAFETGRIPQAWILTGVRGVEIGRAHV